jgi:peptide/nickel transport system ATP-binding protein
MTPILQVDDLTMHYHTRKGNVSAIDGVTFQVAEGESLGLVGESGCGKTSVANALLKLGAENAHISRGRILLNNVDLVPLSETQVKKYRWRNISMVFQAAMNSLNPVHKVGDQIIEAIQAHELAFSHAAARGRVAQLFQMVGLDGELMDQYPHEFSGGMRQRAVIAMALACHPDLVVADEPTTALDVIVQDNLLRELKQLQSKIGMSMIYISHDIAVIAEVSDTIGVMYAGRLVELGRVRDIFRRPKHPYTHALMSAFPSVTGPKKPLAVLMGEPPNLLNPPKGCRFHPRCPFATDICREQTPALTEQGNAHSHSVACWHPMS